MSWDLIWGTPGASQLLMRLLELAVNCLPAVQGVGLPTVLYVYIHSYEQISDGGMQDNHQEHAIFAGIQLCYFRPYTYLKETTPVQPLLSEFLMEEGSTPHSLKLKRHLSGSGDVCRTWPLSNCLTSDYRTTATSSPRIWASED